MGRAAISESSLMHIPIVYGCWRRIIRWLAVSFGARPSDFQVSARFYFPTTVAKLRVSIFSSQFTETLLVFVGIPRFRFSTTQLSKRPL